MRTRSRETAMSMSSTNNARHRRRSHFVQLVRSAQVLTRRSPLPWSPNSIDSIVQARRLRCEYFARVMLAIGPIFLCADKQRSNGAIARSTVCSTRAFTKGLNREYASNELKCFLLFRSAFSTLCQLPIAKANYRRVCMSQQL